MPSLVTLLENTSVATGIDVEDLHELLDRGNRRTYAPGAWLFHESTPRQWAGLIEDGNIDIIRGLHGSTTHLGTLSAGAIIGESALLDDSPHSTGAFTRLGATVIEVPRQVLDQLRQTDPELFYRIVARVAQRLSERLRYASEQLAGMSGPDTLLGHVRTEHDLLGERELPDEVYYGVQTLRGLENFPLSGMPLKNFAHFIDSLAYVKKAAALANHELGVLTTERKGAICTACDDILAGNLHDQFPIDMMQGGAGTSTNMNVNEVIANRGLELMGYAKGDYQHLHPNDDVNCSQSTNDAYPTALKIAVILSVQDTLAGLQELKGALEGKGDEFDDVIKMGRTENQDAVPMTLGQEFSAYAVMIGSGMRSLRRAADELHDINMGATAIGTGLNSPPGYADLVTQKLIEVSGVPVRKAANLVEATQDAGAFVQMSASMKRVAVQLSKICNDLRWLSSGPRCGLQAFTLPPMQPGSSIMPGKVNPVIPEVVNQICYQLIGYDLTVSMAAEASDLELCMAEPVIALNLLHGLMLLKNACIILASRCIVGITPNRDQCRSYVENSIGLVTALNPVLGYEKSVAIAKEALETNGSVYQLVLEKGWLSQDALDDLLRPENMTHPRQLTK